MGDFFIRLKKIKRSGVMPERFGFEFAKLMTQRYSVRALISLITFAQAIRYSLYGSLA